MQHSIKSHTVRGHIKDRLHEVASGLRLLVDERGLVSTSVIAPRERRLNATDTAVEPITNVVWSGSVC